MSAALPSFSVKDKVVLVSGGGKGIGAMIARGFVEAGAKVYISSRDAKSLEERAKELTSVGPGKCFAITADLSKYDGVEKLVEELSKREKCLHVLVNNAGANWGADLSEYPDAAFSKVITLNLQRVFTLTQKLVPLLRASVAGQPEEGPWEDPARIINIGSVDGLRVPSLQTYAYSASKAGLHHLSRVFASQLGKQGITSNTLACGAFQSKMMKATLEAAGDAIVAAIPLARIGTPQDIAGAFSVKNKVVLVSGGGKGIGAMIARGFVEAGAKVYIASRDARSLEEIAQELTKTGPGECFAIAADLSQYDGVEKLVEELQKREKCLHVLVNNAGATWGADLETYPDEGFSKVMTLNLQRVFTLTQKVVPLLKASLEGASSEGPWEDPARIINIGSIDALRVPSHQAFAYSASKAGLHHMSRVFAAHLGKQGITSNTLACGAFPSKMMKATLESEGKRIVAGIPLGRIGTPQDVAGACVFLASRAGAWVNGATIALDGGTVVGGKL
ncbi:NAD-binding protein [Pseudohyphozyma bogoriensis]|nr:NAD-binding protein [Pseudohyphozyma bogoriensis]